MLKQLLNGNNGLLCVSVTVNKCDCNFSVKIKVLNSKIKFSGHFKIQ